jgi:hypothetical protein
MAGLELFQRHRAAFLDGQAQVEGLLNFIKERVALEESYSKSLLKLSKHTLSIDGTYTPTVLRVLYERRSERTTFSTSISFVNVVYVAIVILLLHGT